MEDLILINGQFVDIPNRRIYPAQISMENGRIINIKEMEQANNQFILPGFIDSHIHIESSMLVPTEFAKIAVTHGTVATVSDPHEIANVCGVEGVDYMIENASKSPMKFYFGAPSCVPATQFETAGATIDADAIEQLLNRKEIKYLAEMMNFPGVLMQDPEVMAKIKIAQKFNKPIDGHAPGLKGEDASKYIKSGITTDHECVSLEEALGKINAGMYIIIREGSAAKNYDTLRDLIKLHPGKVMFCSDDKHPDELIKGHINQLVIRSVEHGYDLFDVLNAACILPVKHYNLEVGTLNEGDPADFIIVDNLKEFKVMQTYIDGELVAENGASLVKTPEISLLNNFECEEKDISDFILKVPKENDTISVRIIEALDGQLITDEIIVNMNVQDGILNADQENDILKIGVVNRYDKNAAIQMGFVKNFGLKNAAMASSVAHDSHNIVFVGSDEHSICEAVNAIINSQGGISISNGKHTDCLPLPIAGLMSDKDAKEMSVLYEQLDALAKQYGSKLTAPFMTLSFMALPVIPKIKITDLGIFDVTQFAFTDLIIK